MSAQRSTNGLLLPRPFLKWVGGKRQLLPELMKRVEAAGDFGRYHEPFVGGGALFFELHRLGKLKKHAWLSDYNPRLVETYEGVRDHVDELVRLLERHKKRHGEEHFYKVRALGEGPGKIGKTLPERAARIIYLNKTCYNGLYRENSKGEFNSPLGRYKNPQICDEENLRAVSKALRKTKIVHRHFEDVVKLAEPGDLVYFDPPYHPVSETASFASYTPQPNKIERGGFGEDSQRLLASVYERLHEKGVKVVLSNSMTDLIRDLYSAYTVDQVSATRAVNSRADRRGKVSEALVRNF